MLGLIGVSTVRYATYIYAQVLTVAVLPKSTRSSLQSWLKLVFPSGRTTASRENDSVDMLSPSMYARN